MDVRPNNGPQVTTEKLLYAPIYMYL